VRFIFFNIDFYRKLRDVTDQTIETAALTFVGPYVFLTTTLTKELQIECFIFSHCTIMPVIARSLRRVKYKKEEVMEDESN